MVGYFSLVVMPVLALPINCKCTVLHTYRQVTRHQYDRGAVFCFNSCGVTDCQLDSHGEGGKAENKSCASGTLLSSPSSIARRVLESPALREEESIDLIRIRAGS